MSGPSTPKILLHRAERRAAARLAADEHGRLWSKRLGCSIGTWQGMYMGLDMTWPRLYHPDGSLVLVPAEAERRRAEAELKRLKGET